MASYYLSKTVSTSFEVAEENIREELKKIGFGILTEIDMHETMLNKLGKDIGKYKVLGACNPEFAFKAIEAEKQIGILLPCNVTIVQAPNDQVEIAVMNPEAALSLVGNTGITQFAFEIKDMLEKALERV